MNLNTDFITTNIELQPDYEGKCSATLISSVFNEPNRASVLYIHGYIDYFFHPHLCEAFHNKGYNFHALDLRKYGRSLLPHQKHNHCENIQEYFEEISIAIDVIKKTGEDKLYLLGHSTGGLITLSYMNSGARKKDITGLILNSPFVQMAQPRLVTKISYIVSTILGKLLPNGKVNEVISPLYAKSVHKDYSGEWDFNLDWKPINGFPMYFKWYVAIVNAQRKLQKSNITVPVLLMHSDTSFKAKKYTPEIQTADIVLNINDMKAIAPKLGNKVTLLSIKDAKHDIFLSSVKVRETAFIGMFTWLLKN